MDLMSPDVTADDESARTSSHRSGRRTRVEVLTRAEPRRAWTAEQKGQIVAESLGPDRTPTEIARKYGISTGQLYTWRQQLLKQPRADMALPPVQFAAVELASATTPRPPSLPAPTSASARVRAEGMIEIALPCGTSLRVDAHVDTRALRRVLTALARR